MENIAAYLLQITGCALICSAVLYVLGEKGAVSGSAKLLYSLAMTVYVLSPWVDLDFEKIWTLNSAYSQSGEAATAEGENSAQTAMGEIISQQTQAYILDKAVSLGADLTVSVQVSNAMPPTPCRVRLQGNVSPYGKQVLSDWIAKELNIAREAQQWN